MHKSLQCLFILISHDARPDLPRGASPRSSAELLLLTWRSSGTLPQGRGVGEVTFLTMWALATPSVLNFSDLRRIVFLAWPMQTCRTVGRCWTESLPEEDGGKTSWSSKANEKDDGSVKQTSPLQVPLKRSGFKSNERFRKFSDDGFKDRISTKQLGPGRDTNVNISPVQNWYPSQVQGFLPLVKKQKPPPHFKHFLIFRENYLWEY